MNPSIFRKRTPDTHPSRDPWSTRLRQLGELVNRGEPQSLFDAINHELAQTNNTTKQSQLLSLVGDCQAQQGDFANALVTYDRAAQLVSSHPRLWFRPVVAAINALLRNVQVEQARIRANAATAKARAVEQQFAQQIAQLEAQANAGAQVTVSIRPLRSSVVGTRLGQIFLREGEVEAAEALFQEALIANPQGATRARIGLAEIALRENRPQDAKDFAFAAMQVGHFRAKTLPAFSLFLRAGFQLGQALLDQRLITGLAQATPAVRDRAIFTIVKTLRSQSNPQWVTLSNNWLATNSFRNPVIAAELRKQVQASARLRSDDDNGLLATSEALLFTANLSPSEFLCAAKTRVRSSLTLGQNVDLFTFATTAAQRYGPKWRGRVLHSLALSCMMARRHDLARTVLQQNLAALNTADEEWAKSLWALARMEAVLSNHSAAAQLFRQFAAQSTIPERFRALALLKALQSLISTGDPSSLEAIKQDLAALDTSSDFDLLMGFARQLKLGPPQFANLALQLFLHGKQVAIAHFKAAEDPSVAIRILLRITRSQVYDFGEDGQATAIWTGLTALQRQWLWSGKNDFWEYTSLIVTALARSSQLVEARALADSYLNDVATPLEGRLRLMAAVGHADIRARNYLAAFPIFREMISLSPAYRLCAEPYYWLAIAAKASGDDAACIAYAEKSQFAQGTRPSLLSEWELDCKACLLRSGLVVGTTLQSANYDTRFQARCLAQIRADLAVITV